MLKSIVMQRIYSKYLQNYCHTKLIGNALFCCFELCEEAVASSLMKHYKAGDIQGSFSFKDLVCIVWKIAWCQLSPPK